MSWNYSFDLIFLLKMCSVCGQVYEHLQGFPYCNFWVKPKLGFSGYLCSYVCNKLRQLAEVFARLLV